jgi:hypothetical protein
MRLAVLAVVIAAVYMLGVGWWIATSFPGPRVWDKPLSGPLPTAPYRAQVATCDDKPDPRERSHTPQCDQRVQPRESVSPAQRVDLMQRP